MTERGQRIRLGLFVIVGLIAVATLVVLFGKRPTLFANKDRFHVTFSNAPNLQPGTPVRRSGIRIGEVETVQLDEAGHVKVTLNVDRKYPPRKNEDVVINQSLLAGDATVDFITNPDKKDDNSIIKPEDTAGKPIEGKGPLDARSAVGRAEQVGASAQDTLKAMQDLFTEYKKMKPEISKAVQEYTLLSETIRQAVPEIQQTNTAVRDLARATNSNIPALKETKERADLALKQWNDVGERLNVFMKTNDQKLSKSVDNLNNVLEQAAKVFNEDNQKALTALIQNLSKMFGAENQKAVTDLLANINKVMSEENIKNINATIKNVKDASTHLEEFAKNGTETMKQVKDTVAKADQAIENIRKVTQPLGDHADEISRNLIYSSGQFGLLMKDARDLLRGYANSEGSVQKLLTDPSLYNRANETLYGFSRLMPKLELILEDLKAFSDQIARHPNRLIFDKGFGLKGSPFAPTTPLIGNSPMYRQGTNPSPYPQ
jgi:phospholipid/cholesterol/gamma-HCH transport system substrate-binding protein